MKNQKGFSLIELLIVVVIIGIIAAIAIPNLLAARRAANEGSAQSTTRTLHSGEVTFAATQGNGNYAGGTKFGGGLSDMKTAGLIDSQLATGVKSGYNFTVVATDAVTTAGSEAPASFAVGTVPTVATAGVTQTGTRKFCVATDGIVRTENTTAVGTNLTKDTDCNATGYTAIVQ